METNLQRWSNLDSLSELWNERAKLIAEWLPHGAHVVDIGCGRMAVEGLLKGGSYHPVDVVRRDARTLVVDLNKSTIPDSFFKPVDHATLLGTLEYLADPAALLKQLNSAGITLICTYQLANYSTPEVRQQNGWFNAFRATEFTQLLKSCGFEIVNARLHDNQGLYLARPTQPKFRPVTKEPKAKYKTGKKRLVLSGFFGRGNAGDEALLQVQYEHLCEHFEIIISVEERGAYQGFWDWYPYNECAIIHQAESSIFAANDIVGLHVGGGDLPFGFNGGQVLAALGAGKQVAMSGIDCGSTFQMAAEKNPQLVKNYLTSLAGLFPRSEASFRFLQPWAEKTLRGADWALQLQADHAPNVKSDLTLVVLREFPLQDITPAYRECVAQLIGSLERQGRPFALLPFCPEDDRFLNSLDAVWGAEREVHWWNPRRLKQLIAQCRLVISVGRLHPLIFAASVGKPAVFADLHTLAGGWSRAISKAQYLCQETGIPYLSSLPELCDWVEQLPSLEPLADARFPRDYATHFETMKNYVVQIFA